MADHIYKMLAAEQVQEQTIQRSRFITFAAPAFDSKSAREYIASITKKHPQANHCCWAYLVGYPDHVEEYYSDAGEPSGTAGAPILSAIKQSKLKNLSIVIVRYFGGVKLGVRGLIDAYRGSAAQNLAMAPIINCQTIIIYGITCNYSQFETLKYFLEKAEGTLDKSEFSDKVNCILSVPEIACKAFEQNCQKIGLVAKLLEIRK